MVHVENLPVQLKKMKDYIPAKGKNNENLYENWMDIEDIKVDLLKRFKVIDTEEGSYAVKHRIGHIGSSVTHLGLLL